ncbi:MAG: hypothetical protein WC794_03175 [Candidatus Doudnabacteria bacterium]
MVKKLIAQLEKWAEDKTLRDRNLKLTLRSGITFEGKLKAFCSEDKWVKVGEAVIDITEVAAYTEGY